MFASLSSIRLPRFFPPPASSPRPRLLSRLAQFRATARTIFLALALFLLPLASRALTEGDYTYTVADGQATIAFFNRSFSGALSITKELGGYPVTTIGYQAFYNCTALTSVTIPDSVTSIGASAFYGCTTLTHINVHQDNPAYASLDGVLFDKSQTALLQYPCGKTGAYTVPDGTVFIESSAFKCCALLTSVNIPASVTSIGENAFYWCTSLASVLISTGVTSIGEGAFSHCTSLVSVTIGNSVTAIGINAFSECTALTSVTIPASITSIALYAFYHCTSLTSVFFTGDAPTVQYGIFISVPATVYYLPGTAGWGSTFAGCPTVLLPLTYENDGGQISIIALDSSFSGHLPIPSILDGVPVTSIGDAAFSGCTSLTSVTIPDRVTSIGAEAFSGCTSLTSVTIPDSVTAIGEETFSGCASLTSITIPDSVTSIGAEAFAGCTSLTSVTIPGSVTSIGDAAFSGCASLASVTISAGIASVGPLAFSGCTALAAVTWDNELLSPGLVFDISLGTIKTLVIGNSVTSVGDWAFSWCGSLASVTIPAGVTYISYSAFLECTGLTNFTVDAANPAFASPDGVLFNEEVTILHRYPAGKTGSYTIPDSVEYIDFNAFSGCASLTSVTIPGSVTSIGDWAFAGCTSLTSVTVPDSVASMGSGVFDVCTTLTHINVHQDNPAYASLDGVLFDKSQTALLQYPCGKTGAYTVPDGTVFIESSAFKCCALLTSVTIPASVTFIGLEAFVECASLSCILFAGDAPLIAYNAFVDTPTTLYYLPGTAGWSDTVVGRPAVCWNPTVQRDAAFGFESERFGFNIAGTTNIPVRIEATTNLASGVWTSLTNTTLGTSGSLYFADPASPSPPSRFYRIVFP